MKISVVMTTYNGEKYVETQLKSILNQTKQPDRVLIFDDGSIDSTMKIVENFISINNLETWKLIVNDTQKGWKKNFMDGINLANSEVVFLSDQDDIWENTKLEEMIEVFNNHPEVNVLVSNFKIVNSEGKLKKEDQKDDFSLQKIAYSTKAFYVQKPGCTMAFRKNYFNCIKDFWYEGLAHDALLWRLSSLDDSLYILNRMLISYRHHESNASRQSTTIEQKKNYLQFLFDLTLKLTEYIENRDFNYKSQKIEIISRLNDFFKFRLKAYNKKSLFMIFMCGLKYYDCYSKKNDFLGDVKRIIKKQ